LHGDDAGGVFAAVECGDGDIAKRSCGEHGKYGSCLRGTFGEQLYGRRKRAGGGGEFPGFEYRGSEWNVRCRVDCGELQLNPASVVHELARQRYAGCCLRCRGPRLLNRLRICKRVVRS